MLATPSSVDTPMAGDGWGEVSGLLRLPVVLVTAWEVVSIGVTVWDSDSKLKDALSVHEGELVLLGEVRLPGRLV